MRMLYLSDRTRLKPVGLPVGSEVNSKIMKPDIPTSNLLNPNLANNCLSRNSHGKDSLFNPTPKRRPSASPHRPTITTRPRVYVDGRCFLLHSSVAIYSRFYIMIM